MSTWTDRIKEHALWTELTKLGILVDSAYIKAANEEGFAGLTRIKDVLAYCGKRLAATDPFLITIQSMDSLLGHFNEISFNVTQFTNDGNETYIVSANLYVDAVIKELANTLQPVVDDAQTIVNETMGNYRSALEVFIKGAIQSQSELVAIIDTNEDAINKQEIRISEEHTRLTTVLADYQTSFSTAQDARATEYATSMSEYQKEFTSTQIANQKAVAEFVAEANLTLTQKTAELDSQLVNAQKKSQINLNRLRTEFTNEASELLEQIKLKKEEVEKLVGIIGNLGVTSGYLNEANSARFKVYIWQAFTVLALGGLTWIAYVMAFPPEITTINDTLKDLLGRTSVNIEATKLALNTIANPETSSSLFYQGLATRVFLSITFGIFAAYSAKQAEKYMEIDRRNRKLALELAAVGAYIAPLPIDMQDSFRKDLGEKSFGVIESDRLGIKDPVNLIDLIKSKECEEFVLKIVNAIKSK